MPLRPPPGAAERNRVALGLAPRWADTQARSLWCVRSGAWNWYIRVGVVCLADDVLSGCHQRQLRLGLSLAAVLSDFSTVQIGLGPSLLSRQDVRRMWCAVIASRLERTYGGEFVHFSACAA